jgi:hypothetical protein
VPLPAERWGGRPAQVPVAAEDQDPESHSPFAFPAG